ncbi:hypothetical protein RQP46_006764 [Phenoliferia psychrophenolica]
MSTTLGNPPPPPTQAQVNGSATGRAAGIYESFTNGVAQVAGLVKASAAPLPTAPDGLSAAEASAPSDPKPQLSYLQTILEQAKDGLKVALHAAQQLPKPLDDRKLLLEEVVTLLGRLPSDSTLGTDLSNTLIRFLWLDLPHPPAAFVGASRFRSADGSGNNPSNPTLGQAGTPYARSVSPIHPLPHNLPDPGVVFDALLKRDRFEPHPSGISSLLFGFATLIIHSAFQTSRTDPSINETSSYLDLSVLYGVNQKEQNAVRTFKQGELWPDTWASDRLGLMPPHVAALLVIFCRNHNFITNKLFSINERGKFKPVSALDADGIAAQDEELFQTARLINCGFFVNVVFYDYIRCILNQNRTDSPWALFPNGVIKTLTEGAVPRGVGNSCSVEFNILYRWHAAISAEDEKWTDDLFARVLPGKTYETMTESDFITALTKLAIAQGQDPKKWTFGGLKRQGPDGTGPFEDSAIAELFTKATESVAGAFKARGSPACMRVIDVLGIATARNDWNTCSMNEFRKFLNLKPFDDFKDWNSDPKIWKTAEKLYSQIENLELFPGLSAEERKPSQDGSGLAPGYTISRAILSDAVALVRGDRHFTSDFDTASLTNWGFEDVQPAFDGGAFGGVVGKILLRTLPTVYKFNSIFALFPFSTPETTRKNLTKLGIADQYDFSRPTAAAEWRPAFTYDACSNILADHHTFGVIYDPNIKDLTIGKSGFFLGFDDVKKHARDRSIMDQALFPKGYEVPLQKFYRETTQNLIKESAWSYDQGKTFNLDVVRDIASALWCADTFGIPLKTEHNPHGLLTPQELYSILAVFFTYVFMNFNPEPGFALRKAAVSHAKVISSIIQVRLAQVTGVPAKIDGLARWIQDKLLGPNSNALVMTKTSYDFYARLLKSTESFEHLNASTQCIMTASTANQGEVAAHVINFYLDDKQKEHYTALVRLSKDPSPAADDAIWAYILEAMRLDPQAPGIPRIANESGSFKDGSQVVTFQKGDMIFASLYSSGRDPAKFPHPDEVDITRDPALYNVFGAGMHNCLGSKLVRYSMVAMIKEVFKLKNVRRAPGAPGSLFRFTSEVAATPVQTYLTASSALVPFPVSLSVVFDA